MGGAWYLRQSDMRQHKILNTSKLSQNFQKRYAAPGQEMLDNMCQTLHPSHSNLNDILLKDNFFLLKWLFKYMFWERRNGSYICLVYFTVAQIYFIKIEGRSQLWSNCLEPSEESPASIISGLMMYLQQQSRWLHLNSLHIQFICTSYALYIHFICTS